MVIGVAMSLTVCTFAGCDSTQNKNARAELVAKRYLGGRELLEVKHVDRKVQVTQVALVRGRRSSAIVVDLRNHGAGPLTDVPIEVGVRSSGGRREALNVRRNLDWFQRHVPAIPGGGTTTWVFQQRKRAPAGKPYARVGDPSAAISRAASLPRIDATAASGGATAAPRVTVANVSNVPQYGLQVYALVRERGRYVAAGKEPIEHLGTGGQTVVRVPLTGKTSRGDLRVYAAPAIFE